MTFLLKCMELAMLVYVSYKQPLLGIICAFIFIRQMPTQSIAIPVLNPSRIALDEQMRPKSSNTMIILNEPNTPYVDAHLDYPEIGYKYLPF